MLYKNRLSPLRAAMSYLLILPLAAVLLTFSSMRLSAQTTDEDKNEDEVFQVVEEMPQYPGGNDALIKHLSDNLKYPKEAEEDRIEGIVYVSFIVDTDGSISDVKIVRGIGDSCDEEAQRVVASMPDWKPGKQRGKPVRVQFNLPIRFTLDDDKIENTDE